MQYFKEIFGRESVTYSFCDNAPQWVQGAVYEAHQGSLPNDWVFGICKAAFDYASNRSLTEDDLYDLSLRFADNEVDIYNKNIAQWYANHCNSDFVSEAEDELRDVGFGSDTVIDTIKQLQYLAIKNIAYIVFKAAFENQSQEECVNG
jgi:hypothetical protein